MARTQALRPCLPPCLLHVELLENRWLLTGQFLAPVTPLTATLDVAATALVTEPVALAPALDKPMTVISSSNPATNDPLSTGGVSAQPGNDTSVTLTDPSLSQGNPSQAADGNANGTVPGSAIGTTAQVTEPVALTPALENPTVVVSSSDPATNDPSNTGDASVQSGNDTSGTPTDPSLSQGDPSQAVDGSTNDTVQDSGTNDPSINQSQDSSLNAGTDPIQPVQDAGIPTDNPITDQTIVATPVESVPADSLTIVPSLQDNQQGSDSGSGTSGNDSGSGSSDSGTSTSGDQTASDLTTQDSGMTTGSEATNPPTRPADTLSTAATALTSVMGPEPARTTPGHSSGGNSANGSNDPAANPGEPGPATPPAAPSGAPKLPDNSVLRLPSTLVQVAGTSMPQRLAGGLEASPGHGDSIRPAEVRESADSSAEKHEGAKGSFVVEEQAPPTAEGDGSVVLVEDISAGSRELVGEPAESPTLVRTLPSAGTMLLATVAPFDLPALQKGVHGFFAQLEQMSEQIVAAHDRTGMGTWVVALATAGVALEVARRKLKPAAGSPDAADGSPDATWNWLLAPDPG